MGLFEILTISGLCLSLIIGFYNLLKLRRNRVNLKINISQKNFDSHSFETCDGLTERTNIYVKADITNKGLEPTSISKITMNIISPKLIGGDMFNSSEISSKFKKIRIEPNDRKIEELNISYPIHISNEIDEIETELIFYTTYKDIIKKIKIIRPHLI